MQLMNKPGEVNDYVRRRIRDLRKQRGLTAVEFAKRLSLPRTSYVSMESGAYQIKLDHVHRALEILEAGIDEVWPSAENQTPGVPAPTVLEREQSRLRKLLAEVSAESGMLLLKSAHQSRALLHYRVSARLRRRIAQQIQEGKALQRGLWFGKGGIRGKYYLYLSASDIDVSLTSQVDRFLRSAAEIFDSCRSRGGS